MSPSEDHNQVSHPATGMPVDAAFQEILQAFMSELPSRIETLEQAVERFDYDTIQTLAHQLKGCAAGYGFPALGEQAAVLEQSLRDSAGQADQLGHIRGEVDGLLALCRSYCDRS